MPSKIAIFYNAKRQFHMLQTQFFCLKTALNVASDLWMSLDTKIVRNNHSHNFESLFKVHTPLKPVFSTRFQPLKVFFKGEVSTTLENRAHITI